MGGTLKKLQGGDLYGTLNVSRSLAQADARTGRRGQEPAAKPTAHQDADPLGFRVWGVKGCRVEGGLGATGLKEFEGAVKGIRFQRVAEVQKPQKQPVKILNALLKLPAHAQAEP